MLVSRLSGSRSTTSSAPDPRGDHHGLVVSVALPQGAVVPHVQLLSEGRQVLSMYVQSLSG